MRCILRCTQGKSMDTILQNGVADKVGWKVKSNQEKNVMASINMLANYSSRTVTINKPITETFEEIRLNGELMSVETDKTGKDGDFLEIMVPGKGLLQFKICFEDQSTDNDVATVDKALISTRSCCKKSRKQCPSSSGSSVERKVRVCCKNKNKPPLD